MKYFIGFIVGVLCGIYLPMAYDRLRNPLQKNVPISTVSSLPVTFLKAGKVILLTDEQIANLEERERIERLWSLEQKEES